MAKRPTIARNRTTGTPIREKVVSAAGVLAAVLIAVLVNILGARHYLRLDWTAAKLYTLSAATVSTLKSLEQPIRIEILLARNDPLSGTVNTLLEEYKARSTRLDIHAVDPDQHPAEFIAVQQKYGILAGRTEDGRVVTDAAIVVASDGKHWFVSSADLIDLGESKSQSKVEQALTGAIRAVVGGERLRVCGSTGHGEDSLDDASQHGLGELRERLAKDNYEPVVVDSTRPDAQDPFKDCRLLIVAGPKRPFSRSEAEQVAARMQAGMNGLFLLDPLPDADQKKLVDTGLEPVTKLFGVGLVNDLVFELDNERRLVQGQGEVFTPEVKSHPITEGLLSVQAAGLRVVLAGSRSLLSVEGPRAGELLVTSPDSFGMVDFHSWDGRSVPKRRESDPKGPVTVGMASELPKPQASQESRGARLVVIGAANVASNLSLQQPQFQGNGILVKNAVSWLVSRPPILDVPARETPTATLHITEASLGEILRYVMLFMPAAAALLGVSVYLLRRSEPKARKQANKRSS